MSEFEKVNEVRGVEKWELTHENADVTEYRLDNARVKVAHLGSLGWSVRLWGDVPLTANNIGEYYEDEAAAHQRAKELIESQYNESE